MGYTVLLCFSLFKTGKSCAVDSGGTLIMRGGDFIAYIPVPKDLSAVKTKVFFQPHKAGRLSAFGAAHSSVYRFFHAQRCNWGRVRRLWL